MTREDKLKELLIEKYGHQVTKAGYLLTITIVNFLQEGYREYMATIKKEGTPEPTVEEQVRLAYPEGYYCLKAKDPMTLDTAIGYTLEQIGI